ncbi:hypothetical protein SVIOM342S_00025 [Streptomyces violaceorubidus]
MAESEWQDAVITRGRDTRRCVLSSTRGTAPDPRPAPVPSATPPIRRRNHHDRTLHPSYDRRAHPASSGRCDRGRRRPASHRMRRPDRQQRRQQRHPRRPRPLADKLPQSSASGTIKVGSDIAHAPVEFKDGGKTVGIDPDLADALGKQLGVKFEFENGTFAPSSPACAPSGTTWPCPRSTPRTARTASTPTPARRSATASTSSTTSPPAPRSTPEGRRPGHQDLADLCGQVVALQVGTTRRWTWGPRHPLRHGGWTSPPHRACSAQRSPPSALPRPCRP